MWINNHPKLLLLPLSCIVVCSALAACTTTPTDPVATYTGGAVSLAQLSDRLALEPIHVQKKFNSSAEEKRAYVESLVDAELMQQEARRRQIDQQPRIRAQIQRILVRELERQVEQESAKREPTDEELQQAYDQERPRFEMPRMVRASVIVLQTKDEAATLRAGLQGRASAGQLDQLARKQGMAGVRQGDLGHLHAGSKHVPEPIRIAALSLPHDGDLSPPVQLPRGWALVLRTGERPALTRSLEQLRPMLQARSRVQRGRAAVTALTRRLREEAKLTVENKLLEEIQASERVALPSRQGGSDR